MNVFALPQNLLTMLGFLFIGYLLGSALQSRQDQRALDDYGKNYFDASDRASRCNEDLRLRIQEHNGCEAALRKCRERIEAPPTP